MGHTQQERKRKLEETPTENRGEPPSSETDFPLVAAAYPTLFGKPLEARVGFLSEHLARILDKVRMTQERDA